MHERASSSACSLSRLRGRGRCRASHRTQASRVRWGGERTEYAEGASSKTDASETAMMKILLTFALIALATPAQAQDYPTRPIKAVTTTSAGGISDIFMRALGGGCGLDGSEHSPQAV